MTITLNTLTAALEHMRALAQHRVPSDEINALENLAHSNWMLAIAKDCPDMSTGKAHAIFWDLVDNIVGKTHDCDYTCALIEDEGLREALRQYMDKHFRDTRVFDIRELDQTTRIAVQKAVRIREKRDRVPTMGEVNYDDEFGHLENVDRNPEWDARNKEFEEACKALPENCRCLARNAIYDSGNCYLPRHF